LAHILVLFFFFLSSPNLSRRRLVVCHTSTHSVALVRISDACLKPAAHGSLQIQAAKSRQKSPSAHHSTICRAISSQLRHVSTIGKKILSSSISSRCPHNMMNFGPLAAEIYPVVWGIQANFNGFRVLLALLYGTSVVDVNHTLRR